MLPKAKFNLFIANMEPIILVCFFKKNVGPQASLGLEKV